MKNQKSIAWLCLIAAGLIELVWAYFMKLSNGFTEVIPSLITLGFIILSFFLLEKGMSTFGIGMSYGVFTGIGIAGTTIIGFFAFNEAISFPKIVCLIILLTGIIGLKIYEGKEEEKV